MAIKSAVCHNSAIFRSSFSQFVHVCSGHSKPNGHACWAVTAEPTRIVWLKDNGTILCSSGKLRGRNGHLRYSPPARPVRCEHSCAQGGWSTYGSRHHKRQQEEPQAGDGHPG